MLHNAEREVKRNSCSKNEENIARTSKKVKSEISECISNTPLVPLPIGPTVSSRRLTRRVDLTPGTQ